MLEPRYVDTREPEFRRAALERAGFRVRTLHSGDVQFPEAGGGTVLIEHKTVSLLLADMANGTLQRQCRLLCESCDFPVLLVEGHWQQVNGTLLNTRYTWQAAWNQLQTLQDLGVRLQLATGREHAIQRIIELAEYYGHAVHHSVARAVSGDVRVTALSLIYGVDATRAAALLDHYGSLSGIGTSSEDALQELPGFGPKLARRIKAFFHE